MSLNNKNQTNIDNFQYLKLYNKSIHSNKNYSFVISLQLIILSFLFVTGYIVALKIFLPYSVLLLLPLSILITVLVIMAHDAGHQSLYKNKKINLSIFTIFLSIMGGASITYWKKKHNIKHHNAPNVVGSDDDIEIWPLSLYKLQPKHATSKLTSFFQKYCQSWMFWFMCFLLIFSIRIDSVIFFCKQRSLLSKLLVLDILFVVLHYILWIILPSILFGFTKTIICYGILSLLVGWMLSIMFIVGHTGKQCLILSNKGNRWVDILNTTQNIKLPYVLSWMFTGLDYQIEHHFFPKINYLNLKRTSTILKEWATSNNYPYHETTLFDALKQVYLNLKKPRQIISNDN